MIKDEENSETKKIIKNVEKLNQESNLLDRKRAQVVKIIMELKESYEELDDARDLAF